MAGATRPELVAPVAAKPVLGRNGRQHQAVARRLDVPTQPSRMKRGAVFAERRLSPQLPVRIGILLAACGFCGAAKWWMPAGDLTASANAGFPCQATVELLDPTVVAPFISKSGLDARRTWRDRTPDPEEVDGRWEMSGDFHAGWLSSSWRIDFGESKRGRTARGTSPAEHNWPSTGVSSIVTGRTCAIDPGTDPRQWHCCPEGHTCCLGSGCFPPGSTCCDGGGARQDDQFCCEGDYPDGHACAKGDTCCDDQSCCERGEETCCTRHVAGQPWYWSAAVREAGPWGAELPKTAPKDFRWCCPTANAVCCPGRDFCCHQGESCCDKMCCFEDELCCGNGVCCPEDKPIACTTAKLNELDENSELELGLGMRWNSEADEADLWWCCPADRPICGATGECKIDRDTTQEGRHELNKRRGSSCEKTARHFRLRRKETSRQRRLRRLRNRYLESIREKEMLGETTMHFTECEMREIRASMVAGDDEAIDKLMATDGGRSCADEVREADASLYFGLFRRPHTPPPRGGAGTSTGDGECEGDAPAADDGDADVGPAPMETDDGAHDGGTLGNTRKKKKKQRRGGKKHLRHDQDGGAGGSTDRGADGGNSRWRDEVGEADSSNEGD